MAFGLKGGRDFDNRFLDASKLTTIETHVADCHTCVLHPASHTHRQLSDEQLRAAGIAPDLIRLSIGLEDPEDIINDLKQALKRGMIRQEITSQHTPGNRRCAQGRAPRCPYFRKTQGRVIWICHALTANSNPEDWWPEMVGPGRTIDPDKDFVVCVNMLGSAYGSESPARENPPRENPGCWTSPWSPSGTV